MKLAVVINTYQRGDGSTPLNLRRALDSVKSQTHQDYKVFVIGDRYENNEEFEIISKDYDQTKFIFKNLDFAEERDVYGDNKWAIWSYGGVNARNVGMSIAKSEGFSWICHLDHDDEWLPNHLYEFNRIIESGLNPSWMCTKSMYLREGNVLPGVNSAYEIIPIRPRGATLIHSSVCINNDVFDLKYRDLFKMEGKVGVPSDHDMLDRVCEKSIEQNLNCFLINKITCKHMDEGYERR
jgi:glycosyltransferase involved in cell wall biosynthesis